MNIAIPEKAGCLDGVVLNDRVMAIFEANDPLVHSHAPFIGSETSFHILFSILPKFQSHVLDLWKERLDG